METKVVVSSASLLKSPEACGTVGLALQVGSGLPPRPGPECRVGALVWGSDPRSLPGCTACRMALGRGSLLLSRWLRPSESPGRVPRPILQSPASSCIQGSRRPPYRDNQSQVGAATGLLPTVAPRNLSDNILEMLTLWLVYAHRPSSSPSLE